MSTSTSTAPMATTIKDDIQVSSHTTLTLTTTSLHNLTISSQSDHIFYEITTPSWEPEITKLRRRDPDLGQFDLVGEIKYDIGGHGSGSEHGANGDADGDTASDDTRVGWSGGGGGGKGKLGLGKRKKIDKGKGKAKDEGEEEENANPNPNPNANGQKTEYESNRKKRGRPVEVRVWGELYRGIEEWLPRAEGQDKVTGRFKARDGTMFLWRRGQDADLELVNESSPSSPPVATYHRHKRYLGLLRIRQFPTIVVEASVLDTLDSLILSWLLIERRRRECSPVIIGAGQKRDEA
ncbi:uncharacterized protein STEHIDRAFT_114319 [Stereum hirsutum FP-91666 SS1]|uniref:uncharacterized protein n=1 Tax=Stereum hirsutum (strain FP-91666) TaxID=721885 RepID=UPI000444A8CE|nr:uncharacterized protein STEHIDRAFT_114319 [Stereum hirsutum FP-91666 SS1]EIM82396.1 hypothetical protein STEHIDRAFT_114319 [Stereum hirsutum FP-91666 SS1]